MLENSRSNFELNFFANVIQVYHGCYDSCMRCNPNKIPLTLTLAYKPPDAMCQMPFGFTENNFFKAD